MIEDLVIDILSNAPAVVALMYLVYRLDQRIEELIDVIIDRQK